MENSSNEQANNDLKASLTAFKLFLTEALLDINKAISMLMPTPC